MSSPEPHLQFTKLFVAAQPSLYGYLMSLVHDRQAADELIQELAERLWHKFPDYDASRPFVAWGIGFARYLAMEWRRRQRRLSLPLDEATLEALAETAEDDLSAQDARLEALRACLAKLTGRQREVLRQRYEESLPVAVIAESAQRTPMAVYKAIKQAHLALFDCVTRTLGPSAP
ncbi:MAG: sigma-70 family RNA polymerase sigma factor [Verrucomicrobiota bacterium]